MEVTAQIISAFSSTVLVKGDRRTGGERPSTASKLAKLRVVTQAAGCA